MKKTLELILILLTCVLGAGKEAFAESVADRCAKDSLKFRGQQREYWIKVPDNLSPEAPLLLCLHGYGGRARTYRTQLVDLAEEKGFAICYPQGLQDGRGKPCWNVGYPFQEDMKVDDVAFLKALVKDIQVKYGINPRNAFLSGMSNGGEMCYLVARTEPDLFAGIISIAGLTLECMPEARSNASSVPFMEVHGTADKTSYWTGDHENKYGWGAYMGVPAAISYVVAQDGCCAYSCEDITVEGHKTVILHKYLNGKKARKGTGPEAEVWLYEVRGGGHNWADKEIDVFHEMWSFMDRFMYR